VDQDEAVMSQAPLVIVNRTAPVVIQKKDPLVIRPLYGAGARGPAGPIGPAGGELIQHVQTTPVTEYTLNHNLGRRVNVDLYTIGGIKMLAEVIQLNLNQVQFQFGTPQAFIAVIV